MYISYLYGILSWFIFIEITPHEFSGSDNANNTGNGDLIGKRSDNSNNYGITPRIIGGTDAREGEFPWQVAIWRKNEYTQDFTLSCSGSIIESRFILTAAHCIVGYDYNDIFVQIGKTNLNDLGLHEKLELTGYDIHDHYDPDTLENDIALLMLTRYLNLLHPYFTNIRFDRPGYTFDLKYVIATGWGVTHMSQMTSRQVNPQLQKVTLEAWNRNDCRKGPIFICAGGTIYGGEGVCVRDSGGPLHAIVDDKMILVGIVSHGIACAKPNEPDYFVNVTHYIDWIHESMDLLIQTYSFKKYIY